MPTETESGEARPETSTAGGRASGAEGRECEQPDLWQEADVRLVPKEQRPTVV